MSTKAGPFTPGILAAIGLLYAVGFALVLLGVGPWEAARRFAVEGGILALWLLSASYLLRDLPGASPPVKRPARELALGVVGLALGALALTARFLGSLTPVFGAGIYVLPLAVFLGLRYDRRAMGLTLPPRRGWLALGVIVAANLVVGVVLGRLLPAGELPTAPGEDLAAGIHGPLDVALLLGQLLVVAALPEELYLRVYLQPRLAHYLPIGWAMLAQALLFSALHTPRNVLLLGHAWPLAVTEALVVSNGLVGGYLWWKTRSLPLLLVLHLLAYPRYGL